MDMTNVRETNNPKHNALVMEYMNSFDKIESYMKVYNCSKTNARANSYRVFNRKDVQQMISDLTVINIKEVYNSSLDSSRIVRELEKIAYGNYPIKNKIDALNILGRASGVLIEGQLQSKLSEIIDIIESREIEDIEEESKED